MWKVVLAGGGTGGHVYPLLAVAEAAGGQAEFVFVGSGGLEAQVVPTHRIPFHQVPSGGVVGKRPWLALRNLARVAAGVLRARGLLRALRPHAVVSTGGYGGYPTGRAWRAGLGRCAWPSRRPGPPSEARPCGLELPCAPRRCGETPSGPGRCGGWLQAAPPSW
jgi:hypothetical protein